MDTNTSFWSRNKGWIIAVATIVILIGWGVGVYNSFVRQNVAIDGQWAQVENQLQRRYDLIPDLVNTVKGVTAQEQKVFGDIATARSQYSGATTPDQRAAAATQIEGNLGRLIAIVESYPNLQSSQAFRDFMISKEGTENRLAVERGKYNDLIKTFNTSVTVFPGSIFAKMFGFSTHSYFEVPQANQVNPTVQF